MFYVDFLLLPIAPLVITTQVLLDPSGPPVLLFFSIYHLQF
jgi:hypothetical protein